MEPSNDKDKNTTNTDSKNDKRNMEPSNGEDKNTTKINSKNSKPNIRSGNGEDKNTTKIDSINIQVKPIMEPAKSTTNIESVTILVKPNMEPTYDKDRKTTETDRKIQVKSHTEPVNDKDQFAQIEENQNLKRSAKQFAALMKARDEAEAKVAQAKAFRQEDMKQAQKEFEDDIEAYQQRKETAFHIKQREVQNKNENEVILELKKNNAQAIRMLQQSFKEKKELILETIEDLIFKVFPKPHRNFKTNKSEARRTSKQSLKS